MSRRPAGGAALLSAAIAGVLVPMAAHAQWSNRYPPVQGYSHHVYLEGYELPSLLPGPHDAVARPGSGELALAARGWLWLFDPVSGVARRITSGPAVDARPAWSPDGRTLAFVRDDGRETWIAMIDLESRRESVISDQPGIELDPAFSADGGSVVFSSAAEGDLDLWSMDLTSGQRTRLTTEAGLELRPVAHPDGLRILYLAKTRGGGDQIRVRDLATGSERLLLRGSILSQTRPALSPDGRTVAFNRPDDDESWELRLLGLEGAGSDVLLTRGAGLPLTPAWSADGRHLWYSEADDDEAIALWRVSAGGGVPERIRVEEWDWGTETARVRIRSLSEDGEPVPARIAATTGEGHPLVPDRGAVRFDGQNGVVFWYSDGTAELTVPAGVVRVQAVSGLATPVATAQAMASPGRVTDIEVTLRSVGDPAAAGWISGDHHFHLNYGGVYRLHPSDLELPARAERLDVATPLLANLHDRFGEQRFWGWSNGGRRPWIRMGQEVRSHFLGHIGIVGTDDLFWPWVWGPGYQVYGADDRENAEVVRHARSQGGFAVYVHPVSGSDPFASPPDGSVPIELIADAVLGDLDGLEVACLWSDERGTSELWYRLLNVGAEIAPTAGTDVMMDFHRTMALGTTRVYVRPADGGGWSGYLEGLREGRSFVTNGPMLDFEVEGIGPGGVVEGGVRAWSLGVNSAVRVDRVEVLVNGDVVWETPIEGAAEPAERWDFRGEVDLPAGGWLAVRVTGPETTGWPAMDSYAFAHTAPVWIGARGSVDPVAARRSATDLLAVLAHQEERLRVGYGDAPIPVLGQRFQRARAELERWIGGGPRPGTQPSR